MELLPGIHRIEGVRGANAYLLAGEKLCLIDTGFPGNGKRVLHYLRTIGRTPEDLALILLTHRHLDHAGSAAELRALTGARVMAHHAEVESLNGDATFIVPRFTHRRGQPSPILRRFLAITPAPVDELLADGDLLPYLGGLRCLHTPGHTPGSLSFFLEQKGILFPGDTILHTRRHQLSRPLPIAGVPPEVLERSLCKLASLQAQACLFAHGSPILDGADTKIRALVERPPTAPYWWRLVRNAHRLALFGLHLVRRD